MNKIITIGRDFGSGGRELGRRLAEQLGYEYYDKEIITEISKHTSLSEEYVQQIVERTPHHLYPITVGHSIAIAEDYTFKQVQSVYKAQSDILKELAEKSNCVIVGRCADYILRDMKPFRLFVHANIDSRISRCMNRADEGENFTEKQMKRRIKSVDRNREKYYNFYTGYQWGDKSNYDLCVNTTNTVIKEIVPVIAKIFE